MAKTFVMDDGYGQLAAYYYGQFPTEPISLKDSLVAEKAETIKKTNLSALLDMLLTMKAGTDVIIVSHGFDRGMIMPLVEGSKSLAQTSSLQSLMNDAPADIEKGLGLKTDAVKDLRAKRDAVAAIGLGHIAFRGCSIGSNKKNLEVLRDYLGAKDASAASVFSTYGSVTPHVLEAGPFKRKWNNPEKDSHQFESTNGKLLFSRGPHPSIPFSDVIKLFVSNKKVLLDWYRAVFDTKTIEATANKVANKVPVHYLQYDPPVMPLDGIVNKANLAYNDFLTRASDP